MSAPILTHTVTGAESGDALLLLNGGMMTFASWHAIAANLGREFRVIAFDFRGMLKSPGTPPPTLDGHVDDTLVLLDHLRVDKVHAVGTSFGAAIAVLLAAAHPERVRSLTLVTATDRITPDMRDAGERLREACRDAAAGGDGGVVFDVLLQTAFSPRYVAAQGDAFVERRKQFAAMPREWFENLGGLLDSIEHLDLRPALAQVRCPTLVVAAELDATFPLVHSRSLVGAVAGARLEVVAGSGHALVAEQPERLLEILRSFLPSV